MATQVNLEPSHDIAAPHFPDAYPLCVDLDGTLIRTDSLLETWLIAFRRKPLACMAASFHLLRGRNHFKCALAKLAVPRADQLPYRTEILELISREASGGRVVVLATGAAEPIATAVAEHVGNFRAVISTDEQSNCAGNEKARRLANEFGDKHYYYAGNSDRDLPVWERSAGAVIVNATPGLASRVAASGVPILAEFPRNRQRPREVFRTLRMHQWSKNLLVFVAILLSHRFLDLRAWRNATVLFLAMSLCASAAYLVNDVFDLEADRSHKEKRKRPFASGLLNLSFALWFIPLLLVCAAGLSAALPASARLWLAGYLVATLTYTLFLKEKLLVDVFLLAGLYTLRVLAGGSATGITISPWTLAFSMFMFLSLAILKRYSELMATGAASFALPRRNYYRSDLAMLGSLGTASGYISVLVLALYIHSPEVTPLYRHPWLLWSICPLVAYWISRMWIFASRAAIPDDPILFALKDRISYLVAVLCAALLLMAVFLR